MRGKRVIEDGLDTTTRITPADAGKTAMEEERRLAFVALTRAEKAVLLGSPPRMRGKRSP